MQYRPLGRTGLVVSAIGFGAWGIGGGRAELPSYGPANDEQSRLALRQAVDAGITFFDTSNLYGSGRSESLIGETLGKQRNDIVIATKAGFSDQGIPCFQPLSLRQSVEASLRRLQTDRIDLLQLHSPDIALLREHPEIIELLTDLQQEGKICHSGISVRSPQDGLAAIDEFGFSTVQINMNMLDLRAYDCGLISRATAAKTALIARTPLCFGFLTGTVSAEANFPPEDHRSRWPQSQIRQWVDTAAQVLQAVSSGPKEQRPVHKALRFCLSEAAVATVLPGLLTAREVEENVAAADMPHLTTEEQTEISRINQDIIFTPSSIG